MSRERAKILKMVADGAITPEDGEKLLNHLDATGASTALAAPAPADEEQGGRGLKYLRVVVDDDGDKVNIRVPIGLIRTGIKLTTLVPLSASEHLSDHGIDLSQFNGLDGDELMEALRDLRVDIDTGDGGFVRVFCE